MFFERKKALKRNVATRQPARFVGRFYERKTRKLKKDNMLISKSFVRNLAFENVPSTSCQNKINLKKTK
jgi:hypothetical protein